MSNSILIDTYRIDVIKDSGYRTWLDFWLNMDAISAGTNVATYNNAKGESEQLALPFDEPTLEMLVSEEFRMILEHLSCKDFGEFENLAVGIDGPKPVIPVNLVVRAVDGSVYFRQYTFNLAAFRKLKRLYASGARYLVWHERPKI